MTQENVYSAHYPKDAEKTEREDVRKWLVALRNAIIARNIVQHPNYSG